jgi:Zn-finger nucleic acid-binding protein
MVESLKQRCPDCAVDLETQYVPGGVIFKCKGCLGKSVGYNLLQKRAAANAQVNFWSALKQGLESQRLCPACRGVLRVFEICSQSQDLPQVSIRLDGCSVCALIWFDHGELEKIRKLPAELVPRDGLRLDSYRTAWSIKFSGRQMAAKDFVSRL